MKSSFTVLDSKKVLCAIDLWADNKAMKYLKTKTDMISDRMKKPYKFAMFRKNKFPTYDEAVAILTKEAYDMWFPSFIVDIDKYVKKEKHYYFGNLIKMCKVSDTVTILETDENCAMLTFYEK